MTYAEALKKIAELEARLHDGVGAGKIAVLERALEPILGTERWDDPLAVHAVRRALEALKE